MAQLVAVLAVEEAGGPSVPLALGRADTWSYPPPGRLPDPDASAPLGSTRDSLLYYESGGSWEF